MTKWTYTHNGWTFGIYPKGTKTKTFGNLPTNENDVQCGEWTARIDVDDYIPNGKKHRQRTVRTGKNPFVLRDDMYNIIDLVPSDMVGKVDAIMKAKKAFYA